jgi:hypothetical protein
MKNIGVSMSILIKKLNTPTVTNDRLQADNAAYRGDWKTDSDVAVRLLKVDVSTRDLDFIISPPAPMSVGAEANDE